MRHVLILHQLDAVEHHPIFGFILSVELGDVCFIHAFKTDFVEIFSLNIAVGLFDVVGDKGLLADVTRIVFFPKPQEDREFLLHRIISHDAHILLLALLLNHVQVR